MSPPSAGGIPSAWTAGKELKQAHQVTHITSTSLQSAHVSLHCEVGELEEKHKQQDYGCTFLVAATKQHPQCFPEQGRQQGEIFLRFMFLKAELPLVLHHV